MKTISKYFTAIITIGLFLLLLLFNVQVGMGGEIIEIPQITVNEAKAGNCPPGTEICGTVDFPPRTPGGPTVIIIDFGQPIIVTP